MNYTIFPPVNNFLFSPLLIAFIGFLHMIVAHFAIGGGFLFYLEEKRCLNSGDFTTLSFLQKTSEKFLYVTIVFGSVSGLGIWFSIALLSPFSTAYLVNRFLWIFAIEWVFFLLSVFFLFLYVETWNKVKPKLHLRIVRIYSFSAFMTLFFINAIITFQLTPTKLRGTINLFKAFFNKTFFPSLLSRTFLSVMIGSLFFLFFVSYREESTLKNSFAKRYFKYIFYSFLLFLVSIIFYSFQIPKSNIENFQTISYLKGILIFSGFLLAVGIFLSFSFCILLPSLFKPHFTLIALSCVLVSLGLFEWIREDLRLPYLIVQRTYGNDLNVKNLKEYQDQGIISFAPFLSNSNVKKDEKLQGELLFKRVCGNCHTIKGINSLNKIFSQIDEEYAVSLVRKSSFFKAPMPPFPGGEDEAKVIGHFLKLKSDKNFPENGSKVFEARCSPCHSYGEGYRDIKKSFEGMKENEIADIIENLDSFTESMPKWSGSLEERDKLAKFLSKNEDGGKKK